MSRSLHFRIWDGTVYHYPPSSSPRAIAEAYEPWVITLDGLVFKRSESGTLLHDIDWHMQPRSVVEQWTGLNDRDGKPIYEGDVLEMADEFSDCIPDDIDIRDPRIVQYPTDARGGLIFRGRMSKVWFSEGSFLCGLHRFIGSMVRVRGNVHQHFHLLT